MGSLAAGPDDNSSGYDSEMDELNIKYISQQMCITRRKKKKKNREGPSWATPLRRNDEVNAAAAAAPARRKRKQTLAASTPFIAQFKLNPGKMRGKKKINQQITFQQVFQNKNNNEGGIIFHFNPGAPA